PQPHPPAHQPRGGPRRRPHHQLEPAAAGRDRHRGGPLALPHGSTSLSRAFMRAILISSSAVLVITSATFFAYDLFSFRQNSLRQLSALGQATAINSSAALAFENRGDAEVVLSALQADPRITAATLYDMQGQLFAAYPRDADPRLLPGSPGET